MSQSSAFDPEAVLAQAGFVHRLAKALVHDADVAHDVAQDALVAAMQQTRPPRNWRGWLDTVTRRLAYKAQAARRNRARREALAARAEADDHPDSATERLRLYERLTRAVLALPEPYRTVVTHRFLDGMSPRGIAGRMNVKSDVVRQQVHRGLLMLRQQLDADYRERANWMRAFVAAGLAGNPAPLFALTTLLMMKSSALAAVALSLLCAWWVWPQAAEPMTPAVTARVEHAVGDVADSPPIVPPASPSTMAREAGAATAAPACEVHVVDEASAPVRGADVSSWSAEGTIITATTDDRGLVGFSGAAGAGGILVRAAGRQSRLLALSERLGRHVVVMPTGLAVSGRLLIDGSPAPSGVQLRLQSAEQPDPEVPQALADRLRWEGTSMVATGPQGSFDFIGLEAGWHGSLTLPDELCLLPAAGGTADEPRRITLTEPRRDLVIATASLPVLAGRVLWADTNEPVAHAQLTLNCEFADGIATPSFLAASDGEGRFVVGLLPSDGDLFVQWAESTNRPTIRRGQVHATADGATAPTTLTFDGLEATAARALVLTLRRTRVTHFLALDTAGKPIAGARVLAAGISDPTDANGRGTFQGRPSDASLVGAAGHRIGPPARTNAAGTAEDPLVLSLAPGNEVRFRVWTADGKAAPGHAVCVRSDRHLFAGGRFAGELDRVLGGPEVTSSAATEISPEGSKQLSDFECLGRSDGDGQLALRSLEPGVAGVASVDTALGGELVAVPFTTPRFGSSLTVDLRIPLTPRQVCGRVLDGDGQPIARARIELRGSRRQDRANVLSGADGSFRFESVYVSGALELAARAEGYVAHIGPAQDTNPGEATNVIHLSVGRSVTVRVTDDDGVVVPELPRLAPEQGVDCDLDRLGPGQARFRNLPLRWVDFECTLGGRDFHLRHHTAEANAELRVPRPGRVVFADTAMWPIPESAGVDCWIVVTRLDETAPAVSVRAREARSQPTLLLPGRYRLELVSRDVGTADGATTPRTLGLATEVVVTAGTSQTVTLR